MSVGGQASGVELGKYCRALGWSRSQGYNACLSLRKWPGVTYTRVGVEGHYSLPEGWC